jgi:glycerophosphoryl diester phosphodiesterase
MSPATARRGPLVIAHRGYSAVAPENTLAAFEAALRAGADLLELDVHLSADGVPVVVHDHTLDATTGISRAVGEVSTTDLTHVDAGVWFSEAYAGQRVPTLAEVLRLTAEHPGAGLLIEFKGRWAPASVAVAALIVADSGIADRCVLQSFDRSTVAALRDWAPDVRRALLVLRPEEDPAAQARTLAAELGVMACNPSVAAVVASPEVVGAFHDAGMQVFTWTVDEPVLWAEVLRWGVDGIITNDPARLRGYLDYRELRLTQDLPVEDRETLARRAVVQGGRSQPSPAEQLRRSAPPATPTVV